MIPPVADPIPMLIALGFPKLEAELYCALLRRSPASAYRIAMDVGKAPPNIYQALARLAQRGAIIISEDKAETRTFRPVPPAEFLSALQRTYAANCEASLEALQQIDNPGETERVYQLQTVAQVLERARGMFELAREIVLFDLFPGSYELLEDSIDEARARGVVVAGITYDERHAGPTAPINRESLAILSSSWPGLGLIVVADGCEQLIAQISRDRTSVMNAIWSDSPFLSATYHSSLAAEIRLTALKSDPSDPLAFISLFRFRPPGLRMVLAHNEGRP